MYIARQGKPQFSFLRMLSFWLVVSLGCLFSACSSPNNQSQPSLSHTQSVVSAPSPVLSSTPSLPELLRPNLERGMIYPQWGSTAYGLDDTVWQQGIQAIKTQTASTWLEIPVLLQQATIYSTSVGPSSTAPSLDAFASGIHASRALGYHVFFVPLSGSEYAWRLVRRCAN